MIESLYIENFAIIDQVQIDFQSGMTVLTGQGNQLSLMLLVN